MASSSLKTSLKLKNAVKKIESPLAKYNGAGQLTCILCNTVVKSEMVWTAHVNGRQHRDKVVALKKPNLPSGPQFVKPDNIAGVKRKAEGNISVSQAKKEVPSDFFDSPSPAQGSKNAAPIKGILKNAPKSLPLVQKESKVTAVSSFVQPIASIQPPTSISEKSSNDTENPGSLPEGFFDDPKLDAKVRQIEYKDPVEEEWNNFQKEIHDEVMVSVAIQEEDQEESTAERQLEEIEEQMLKWGRVLQLEQKKDVVFQRIQSIRQTTPMEEDDSSSGDEAELDTFFDWRSKAT